MNVVPAKFNFSNPSAQGATAKPKSAELTPGPGFRIRLDIPRPPRQIIDMMGEFETPDISDTLNRMYTMGPEIHNVANDMAVVGPACTVKVFPGDNLMVHKALDVAKPGDVIVIDTSGAEAGRAEGSARADCTVNASWKRTRSGSRKLAGSSRPSGSPARSFPPSRARLGEVAPSPRGRRKDQTPEKNPIPRKL